HYAAVGKRRLEVDDAALDRSRALGVGRASRLGVALEDVDPLDDDLVLARERAQDLALLAPVLSGNHHDGVARRQIQQLQLRPWLVSKHLKNLRGQGHALHEVALPERATTRPEGTTSPGAVLVVDQHGSYV